MCQRNKIIERASQMFVKFGIKSIRMDDIAHELGISKRTLYELFTDKEELIYQCIMYLFYERLFARLDGKGADAGSIESIFVGMREITQISGSMHRMGTNLRKFYPDTFRRVHGDLTKVLTKRLYEALNRCMEEGLLDKNIDLELSVTIFYYMMDSFGAEHNIALPDGVSKRDACMYMVINFFRGLSSVEGMRRIDAFLEKSKQEYEQGQK